MAFPLAVGLLAGGGQGAQVLGKFFGAQDAKYQENLRRVAEIDKQNQIKFGKQLQINQQFENKSIGLAESEFNIDTAAGQAKANTQNKINTKIDELMLNNRDNYVAMMQARKGGQSNRTGVGNRAALAKFGRGQATMGAQQRALMDQSMSQDAVRNRQIQNAKAKERAAVSVAPIQQVYTQSYTPVNQSASFGELLGLAGGLASAAATGMSTFDSLKINDPKIPKATVQDYMS